MWFPDATGFQFRDILRLANGHVLFAGQMQYDTAFMQHQVVGILDPGLEPLWVVRIPGTGEGVIGSFPKVIETNDGSFIVTNNVFANSRHTAMIMRLSSTGEVLWTRLIDQSTYEAQLYDVVPDGSDEFIAIGKANGYPLAVRFNVEGTILWSRSFLISNLGGSFSDISPSPAGFLLAGNCNATASGTGYDSCSFT